MYDIAIVIHDYNSQDAMIPIVLKEECQAVNVAAVDSNKT